MSKAKTRDKYLEYHKDKPGRPFVYSAPPARPLKEFSDFIEALTDKGIDITGKIFGIPVELHIQIPKE